MHQLSELAAIIHSLPAPPAAPGKDDHFDDTDRPDHLAPDDDYFDTSVPDEDDYVDGTEPDDDDHFVEICDQIERDRREYAENLEAVSHGLEQDPLILALQEERAKKQQADARIRGLLAYAREFYPSRRYPLHELAEASGYTISGVRTAYDDEKIALVEQQINRRPYRATAPDGDGQKQS